MAIKKSPKGTLDQLCFYDVTSKKVIFEIMIDLIDRIYGENQCNDFLELLQKANEEGEIRSQEDKDIPNAIKKARSLKKQIKAHNAKKSLLE